MARNRQVYQTDLVYVGPTGARNCTGSHMSSIASVYAETGYWATGENMVAPLYRVQRVGWNMTKNLTDVNQFGELAAIDRIPLTPPTVTLNMDYILANLINEKLIGFSVQGPNEAEISMISGMLAGNTTPKNFFLKTVSEGADAIDNAATNYNVIAIGNGYVSSYTAQGAVGGFPTASVTVDALNIQSDAFVASPTAGRGWPIPAVKPSDGSAITGWWYKLPTGTTSLNNATLTANAGLSALRPGDISLSLGLNTAGDTFFDPNDIKIQSFNLSFNLNQEDLNKLGSKYAYAKVPTFPVTCSMQVEAIAGDFVTGSLTEIVDNNFSYNPSVTMYSPGSSTEVIAKFTLKNAKLDTQASDLNIGSQKTFSMTFNSQVGGPENVTAGLFASGITI